MISFFLGSQREETLSWISNTLHDNDDYKLQDLSLDNYGIKSNDAVSTNNFFEASRREEKKQAQRKNINRPINKKGKEKVRNSFNFLV